MKVSDYIYDSSNVPTQTITKLQMLQITVT